MGLKKFRDSKGRECYGVCCDDDVIERLSSFADEHDLRKSAPPAARIRLGDDVYRLIPVEQAVTKLAETRTARPAGPRFQALRTGGESQLIWENGVPVAKAMGDNAARNSENVRKFFGPGSEDHASTGDSRFVPGGLEKQEQALELLKTARANPEPFQPIS